MSKITQGILICLVAIITVFSILSFLKINKGYEILGNISTQSYRTNTWLELIRDKLKEIEPNISSIDTNVLDTNLDVSWIRKNLH